jgi:hypothetical protein
VNAFDISRLVEEQGMDAIVPLLRSLAERGQFTLINKGPLAAILQATVGDVLMNRNGNVYGLEVKVEQVRTGNFFLETWSNKKFEPRKQGWMYTLLADIFWYYFLDADELYSMDFRRLWRWAFEQPSRVIGSGLGRLFDFPEKPQRKVEQLNQTWGRCVPIDTIADEVGYVMYQPRKSFVPVEHAYPPKAERGI